MPCGVLQAMWCVAGHVVCCRRCVAGGIIQGRLVSKFVCLTQRVGVTLLCSFAKPKARQIALILSSSAVLASVYLGYLLVFVIQVVLSVSCFCLAYPSCTALLQLGVAIWAWLMRDSFR